MAGQALVDDNIHVVVEGDDQDGVHMRPSISWDIRNSAGVYCLRFPNGRCYIGSSVEMRTRLVNHTWNMWSGKHYNQKVQRAWSKYGSVEVFPILYCRPQEVLLFEQICIDGLRPALNISPTAGANGWSAESREKISRSRRGFRHTAEAKSQISATQKGRPGRKQSTEEKERRNSKMRGVKRRPWTEEEKEAIRCGMRRAWAEGGSRNVG